MPDPARTRRAPTTNKPTGPLWARAVHHFYDPIFDIRSGSAFQSAINEFVVLDPAERTFHETHLLYRLVLGLEGVHDVLTRIEQRLDATANPDLVALEHLEPIRAALEEIASSRPSLIQVEGWDGEEDVDAPDEEEDRDELDEDEDPDFIYDTVPADEPAQPRRPRRPSPAEAPRPEPPRAAEPEREALVGDLVPATEGPQGAEADR